jgi:replicative DNA helicase
MKDQQSDPRRARTGAEVEAGSRTDTEGTAEVRPAADAFGPYPLDTDMAEAAVLGAMILHRPALEGAAAMLTGADFHRPAHRLVFETLAAMRAERVPVDSVTTVLRLCDADRIDEAGGYGFVSELTDPLACPAPSSWRAYAEVVAREGRRRRGIRVLRRALVRLEAGADPDSIASELKVAA